MTMLDMTCGSKVISVMTLSKRFSTSSATPAPVAALVATHTDCTLTFALNVNAKTGMWVLDDLRFIR